MCYAGAVTTPGLWEFPLLLPRHAFSVRDAARAGDIWRAFQEVAVEGSSRAGWPPLRYRAEGVAFVVRTMTVEHGLEALYGEPLQAQTWVRRFRRDTFSTREVRLTSSRGLIAKGTQEWVHVNQQLQPCRASRAFIDAFPVVSREGDPSARMPEATDEPGSERIFEFETWFTWMDPLDHVNHPAYVDFCDEALARVAVAAGLRPVDLRPRAETVTYSRGIVAPERVRVVTRRVGRAEDATVFEHRVFVGSTLCAKARTVRDMANGEHDALFAAFD